MLICLVGLGWNGKDNEGSLTSEKVGLCLKEGMWDGLEGEKLKVMLVFVGEEGIYVLILSRAGLSYIVVLSLCFWGGVARQVELVMPLSFCFLR